MGTDLAPGQLRQLVSAIVSLECQIEGALERGQEDVRHHQDAAIALKCFHTRVKGQRAALQARLDSMGGSEPVGGAAIGLLDLVKALPSREDPYPVSRVLHIICTAFNHAAMGYAVLHTVAHRSNRRLGRGDIAGMASHHQSWYLDAARTVYQLMPDAVISEMGQGLECRCTCPSCGLGICLCWHSHINWLMPISPVKEGGILVRSPRTNSAAFQSGLRQGNIILAAGADSQEVHHYRELIAEIRKYRPGEKLHLRVLRGAGDLREISITIP